MSVIYNKIRITLLLTSLIIILKSVRRLMIHFWKANVIPTNQLCSDFYRIWTSPNYSWYILPALSSFNGKGNMIITTLMYKGTIIFQMKLWNGLIIYLFVIQKRHKLTCTVILHIGNSPCDRWLHAYIQTIN